MRAIEWPLAAIASNSSIHSHIGFQVLQSSRSLRRASLVRFLDEARRKSALELPELDWAGVSVSLINRATDARHRRLAKVVLEAGF